MGIFGNINLNIGVFTEATLVKEGEYGTGAINGINLSATSHKLEIIPTDGDKIRVYQYDRQDIDEDRLYQSSIENGVLRIWYNKHTEFFIGINLVDTKMVLEIPRSWIGDLRAVTASGSAVITGDYVLKDFEFGSVSGSVKVEGAVSCDSMNVHSTSGSVKILAPAITKNAKVSSVSGSVTIENITTEMYNVSSTSGSVKISGITGRGSVSAISGSVHVALYAPAGDITLESISGSVNLTLPTDLSFTMTASTVSGSISGNFPISYNDKRNKSAYADVGEGSKISIKASSVSGSVRINKREG